MKTKKLGGKYIVGGVIVCVVIYVFVRLILIDSYPKYTENVSDYNSKDFSVDFALIFMDEIPIAGEVISFSHYNYWNEDEDIYMELKFQSEDELKRYLEQVKNYAINRLMQLYPSSEKEWFVERPNPHIDSYTDLLCSLYQTSVGEQNYTGYRVECLEDEIIYHCNFGIISYSYAELTVIQTYSQGHYRDIINNYVPKYFKRFGVPLDKNYEWLYYF